MIKWENFHLNEKCHAKWIWGTKFQVTDGRNSVKRERCLIQKALLRKQMGLIKFFAIVIQRRIQNPVKNLRGLFREMLS